MGHVAISGTALESARTYSIVHVA